jgi:hypothetical protein
MRILYCNKYKSLVIWKKSFDFYLVFKQIHR